MERTTGFEPATPTLAKSFGPSTVVRLSSPHRTGARFNRYRSSADPSERWRTQQIGAEFGASPGPHRVGIGRTLGAPLWLAFSDVARCVPLWLAARSCTSLAVLHPMSPRYDPHRGMDEKNRIQARCRCHPSVPPGVARAMRVEHHLHAGRGP
jgi:hypothetical protein